MKRIILQLLFLAATISVTAQIKTDAELTTQSNVIRNTTDPKALTPTVIANMQQAIIDSKLNRNAFATVTASGTGAYTATVFPAITTYTNLGVKVIFTHANAGAATINFNSLGVVSIKKFDSNILVDLESGDISDNQALLLVYDGTYFQSIGGSGGISEIAWGLITGNPADQADMQALFDGKVPITRTINSQALSGDITLTKSNIGLSNVDNTADASKPVSTAQAAADALNLKIASNLSDINSASTARTNLGLGNVTNTSDANKPVSTAQQTALDLKVDKTTTVNGSPLSSNVTITNIAGNAATVTTNANLTGDVTSAGNATTLATVNSNVGSFGSTTKSLSVTADGKGRITAISEQTVTPAIGSVTGLGTNVATLLAGNTSVSPTELNYVDGVTSAIQTQLDAKAPLASPALTGTPTAPTATSGTSTTQIATTAFVYQEKGLQLTNTQTDNYTLALADRGYRIEMNKATALTLTIPDNGTVAIPINAVFYPMRTGAGTLTIAVAGSATVVSSAVVLTDPGLNVEMKLVKTGTNTWLLQNGTSPSVSTWVPTFTGFSADPSSIVARYYTIGKLVYCWLYTNTGTSSAGTFTVTLPLVASSAGLQETFGNGVNSGSSLTTGSMVRTTTGSNVANVYRDPSGGTAWTSSGGKSINFFFTYEAQ